MMNNIVLSNMGKHVSASIPLTWIAIFQILGSALFQGPQEDGLMAPPKVDRAETHIYTPPSNISPTVIHIVGGNPYHLLNGDHVTAYLGRE